MTRPRSLICACCGNSAIGRQWWNRDTGYGLCWPCSDYILEKEGAEALRSGYGVPGTNFAVRLADGLPLGCLVAWTQISGDLCIGTLRDYDNGTAIIDMISPEYGQIAVRA